MNVNPENLQKIETLRYETIIQKQTVKSTLFIPKNMKWECNTTSKKSVINLEELAVYLYPLTSEEFRNIEKKTKHLIEIEDAFFNKNFIPEIGNNLAIANLDHLKKLSQDKVARVTESLYFILNIDSIFRQLKTHSKKSKSHIGPPETIEDSPEESLEILDDNWNSFEPKKYVARNIVHSLGLKHRSTDICVVYNDFIIVELRPPDKDVFSSTLNVMGGHCSPKDDDLRETAVREMYEELLQFI